MRAGTLKHKLVIEQPTNTQSTSGAQTQTWFQYAVRHGSIKMETATENLESKQITAQRTYLITFRYVSGLNETFRIKFGTRIFSIISVENVEERNREHIIRATEYVA